MRLIAINHLTALKTHMLTFHLSYVFFLIQSKGKNYVNHLNLPEFLHKLFIKFDLYMTTWLLKSEQILNILGIAHRTRAGSKRVTVPPTFHPLPSLLNVINFESESETDKAERIRKRLHALASVSNCTRSQIAHSPPPPPHSTPHTHTHTTWFVPP